MEEHPEYYISGTESDLARAPQNYTRARRKGGDLLLAYGRDPYFSGWPDTLQLNYGNPALQEAMIGELVRIAGQCDGVRCDMAMLVLPEVFERTWGIPSQPFWPKATQRVGSAVPDFCFMAEVYWDLEWTLQQQGFDYTYDKRLYDRLRKVMPGRCGSISTPDSITRTSSPASWRTTMSRERRPRSHLKCTRRPPSLRFYRRGCDFSIRVNSRGEGSGSRPIWSAGRTNPSTRSWSSSTIGCSPFCAGRPFAMADGNCSNVRLPGKATGHGIASWPLPGKDAMESGC